MVTELVSLNEDRDIRERERELLTSASVAMASAASAMTPNVWKAKTQSSLQHTQGCTHNKKSLLFFFFWGGGGFRIKWSYLEKTTFQDMPLVTDHTIFIERVDAIESILQKLKGEKKKKKKKLATPYWLKHCKNT